MFAPTAKGRLLGDFANRHYGFLRGITGAAQEEAGQEMEYAIQKKEDELSMIRFAPLSLNFLLPILKFSVCAVGSMFLFFIVELSFRFRRQRIAYSVRLMFRRFQ